MRVALLRVMPEEGWRSIEIYANHISRGVRALGTDLEFVEVQVPAWTWRNLRLPTPYGRAASVRTLGLYLSRWIKYPLALRRVKADLYHILDNSYGNLAFFLNPEQTVVTSHGGTSRSWRQWQPEGPALWMFDLAFRGTLRAGHIISVSEYARQELLAETPYPPARVHVVHHGVDPVFQPGTERARTALRSQLLQPRDRFLLLHVGHGASRKNLPALYQAVAALRQRGYAVRLVRIGSVPSPTQAELIKSLGIGPAITHISHVDNQELPAYYAAADVFVFPSLYEGFGIPLIEAMACGTPVVCSDSPLFREVCADAACYADPRQPEQLASAIAGTLNDATLAADLRARGLQRAQMFTWEQAAQETLALYRYLLNKAG